MIKTSHKLLLMFLGYTLSFNLMVYPVLLYASTEPTELTQITEQIQKYLCQFNLCLNVIPDIQLNPELKTYGFFFRKTHSIQLAPSTDTGQLKLSLLHEYTHAIRYQYNPNELLWLDEGLANLMEYRFSGVWPVSYSTKLRQELNLILSTAEEDFKPQGRGYIGSFLFITYLYNHFGGEKLIYKLITSKNSGWSNIEGALKEMKSEGQINIADNYLKKDSILRHFAIALWANDAFLAQYALFQMDSQYEALNFDYQSKNRKTKSPGSIEINYSYEYPKLEFQEIWAFTKSPYLVLKKATTSDQPEVFIAIKYPKVE